LPLWQRLMFAVGGLGLTFVGIQRREERALRCTQLVQRASLSDYVPGDRRPDAAVRLDSGCVVWKNCKADRFAVSDSI